MTAPRCVSCGEPLDPVVAEWGTHPTCEPASTVDRLGRLIAEYEAAKPRSTQSHLGPSELGTPCERQVALKLAGVRQPARGDVWAPWQGTCVHAGIEAVLGWDNDRRVAEGEVAPWVIEGAVEILPGYIRGHSDARYVPDEMVVDWKYVGTTALKKLRVAQRAGRHPREQVSQEYRVQAHLYGYGVRRAGRAVRWVRIVLLARSAFYVDSAEWTEPYDERVAQWAIDRYKRLVGWVDDLNGRQRPENLVAVPAAPGDACKWCPFRRVGPEVDATGCRGDTDETAASSGLAGIIPS